MCNFMIYRDRKEGLTAENGHGGATEAANVSKQSNLSMIQLRISARQMCVGLVFLIGTMACSVQSGNLGASGLHCEYRTNPLGVGSPKPRLGWVLESNTRGDIQTAYRILAGSAPEKLDEGKADLWDSGKIGSADSVSVVYAGKTLRSGQRVWWRVRVWDAGGKPSAYSKPAWFEMALLQPGDWQGQWIQGRTAVPVTESEAFDDHPAPLFRNEFQVDKVVERARLYVSGLGYYELRLNGRKVGDHVLDPGWTAYSNRVLYSTYDVTRELKRGRNAVGVMLGNGWFNPLPLAMWGQIKPGNALTTGQPRMILQLVIDFRDGTRQVVVTDPTWRVAGGPVVRNSVYLGEVYDARCERSGWDQPGFDDSSWQRALLASSPTLGPLCPQEAPPIRVTKRLKPISVTESRPGVFIFDFGQNFAGWAQLRVSGPAGTRVRMRSGELLYSDGTLNGMTAVTGQIKGGGKDYVYDGRGQPKTAFQLNEYVLKGEGTEIYAPRFTFHGFRYVEVTGYPGKPGLDALEGLRLNSDVEPVGSFTCSNELFNRIQQMVLWTELANLFSVQSDCPHREKFGYGGDIVASSEMAMLNFDMAGFYAKAAQDLVDAVRPNGGFTETAPFVGISDEGLGEKSGPVGWGTAQPLLAWQLHQYYGDRRTVEAQYEATANWIRLLTSKAEAEILDNGISDHESLSPKPRALTGTAFYFYNVKLFSQIARVLGKQHEAELAEAQAQRIQEAFNARFLKPGTGRYDIASQACQAFALFHDLAPKSERERALNVLVEDIAAHQGHLTTGIFGTKYMLRALTDAGRADVAYEIVNQRTFPGWGHMLEKGATTLWEHWEFSDNTYSHNHPMFGSVSEWFYRALAGINPAPDAAGFNRIIVAPQMVGDLKWVKAKYDSIRGAVISEWTRERYAIRLHVRVPVGVEATVFLPASDELGITESGKSLAQAQGVKLLEMRQGSAVLAVKSGDYNFTAMLK